jgi:hypothetical protein
MAAAIAGPGDAQPRAQPLARAELPVRETVLSDGVRRYSVPITIGGAALDAMLDTGSTGLRVLPGTVPRSALTGSGRKDVYVFASGLRLEGAAVQAQLGLGAVTGLAPLQDIATLSCTPWAAPTCPAARRSGLAGDGLAGEGFSAILGLNMARSQADNPLRALGVKRWIVALPRPGEAGPGRLILNPGAEEAADFVMLPLIANLGWRDAGIHDAAPGCLKTVSSDNGICGPVLLDTGAANITLINAGEAGRAFVDGGEAVLSLGGNIPVAPHKYPPGPRDRASRVGTRNDPHLPRPAMVAGVLPYFAYEVMYDAERGLIGLKPRPPMADGPRALSAPDPR